MNDLRVRVQPILQLGQSAERRQILFRQLTTGWKRLRVRRLPAGLAQVLDRRRAQVHPPGREHAHMAPCDRVAPDLAALEQVDVEALIETGEGGLETDGSGA